MPEMDELDRSATTAPPSYSIIHQPVLVKQFLVDSILMSNEYFSLKSGRQEVF
jgi:hypothetical protein